jgi:hypothetical protein
MTAPGSPSGPRSPAGGPNAGPAPRSLAGNFNLSGFWRAGALNCELPECSSNFAVGTSYVESLVGASAFQRFCASRQGSVWVTGGRCFAGDEREEDYMLP